jgi:hypothetical protein
MNINTVPKPNWIEDTKLRVPLLFQGIDEYGFACGEGWRGIVVTLCEKLDAMGLRKLRVTQIKEKFGDLRFYVQGGNDAVSDLIRQAEMKSSTICELCGAPGHKHNNGWFLTLCEPCYATRKEEQRQYDDPS